MDASHAALQRVAIVNMNVLCCNMAAGCRRWPCTCRRFADVLPTLRRRRVLFRLQGQQGLRDYGHQSDAVQVLPLYEVSECRHVPQRCVFVCPSVCLCDRLFAPQSVSLSYLCVVLSAKSHPIRRHQPNTIYQSERCDLLIRDDNPITHSFICSIHVWAASPRKGLRSVTRHVGRPLLYAERSLANSRAGVRRNLDRALESPSKLFTSSLLFIARIPSLETHLANLLCRNSNLVGSINISAPLITAFHLSYHAFCGKSVSCLCRQGSPTNLITSSMFVIFKLHNYFCFICIH